MTYNVISTDGVNDGIILGTGSNWEDAVRDALSNHDTVDDDQGGFRLASEEEISDIISNWHSGAADALDMTLVEV